MVKPINMVATALACLCAGTMLAATTEPWVGQNIGWRMSFLAISLLGVITMLALWKALPQG
jgi:DHA1 family inner membrane transport protein